MHRKFSASPPAAPNLSLPPCRRRVLERYPTNGRLLKIYGRFLEFCKNDPW